MDAPRARPDEQRAIAGGIVVRRGQAEDLEPAFALWWRAENTRRHGPPPPTSVDRVRGYARRKGAFLLVADAAGELEPVRSGGRADGVRRPRALGRGHRR